MIIYIAGPMRGIPQFNFSAFDAARDKLLAAGYEVVSPADLDRDNGFDETVFPDDDDDFDWTPESLGLDMVEAIHRDLNCLLACDGIYILQGWEKSMGAKAEIAVAKWLGLKVMYEDTARPPNIDILDEAAIITRGDRQASYGPPDQDFVRTAAMWSGLFGGMLKDGVRFESFHIAQAMILLKISRLQHSRKRDSVVDIAGYARCMDICYVSDKGYQE